MAVDHVVGISWRISLRSTSTLMAIRESAGLEAGGGGLMTAGLRPVIDAGGGGGVIIVGGGGGT